MKIFLTIAILLFAKHNLFAQVITDYDTCNHLQQLSGEWKYVNGIDTLRILLRFHRRTIAINNQDIFIKDCLIGWHEYKKGNLIIESDYQNRFMTLPLNLSTSYNNFSVYLNFDKIHNLCNSNSKKLHGRITDYLEASQDKEVFATLNVTNTAMTWKLWHEEWFGHGNGMVGMTLPTNFVLIKQ